MAKVAWTPEAERWLREIHDYIAKDRPETAFRIIQSILKRAQILVAFPQLGYRYERRRD